MNKMKKVCLLLLCLSVMGGITACDMSMLGGMTGGSSVESEVESMECENSSTEDTNEIPDGSDLQDKWNEATKEENFNNVKFSYVVVFTDGTEPRIGTAYLDGDKVACLEDNGEMKLMSAEDAEAVRNIYVKTVLAILDNFTSFSYEIESDTVVSNTEIVYTLNVLGVEAKITADDIRVHFNEDGNISHINCNMKHDFVQDGIEKTLEMQASFTFTDYGNVVVDMEQGEGNPDHGENIKPEGGEEGDKPGDVNPDIEEIPPENENKPEDEIIKEAVTEEGWREAFDNSFAADNYTLTITNEIYSTNSNGRYTAKFNGNVLQYSEGNKTLYYEKDGDAIYCYEEGDYHTWVKSLCDSEVFFGGAAAQLLFGVFKEMYSVFPYQGQHALDYYMSENLTVQYQDGHEETFHRVQIGIRDGYIYHINIEGFIKDEDGNIVSPYRWMFAFSNRDTTVVTLPVTDVETKVTAKKWNAAMEFAVNTNNVTAYMGYTYDYDDDTLDRNTESWMKLKENATHQWGAGTEQYYAKEDGVDYAYRLTKEGLWEKSEVGVEVTYTNYRMASVIDPLRSLYENCGYDEEKGTYFLEAAEVDAGNGTMTTLRNIEIGFRDGELTYLSFEMDMMNSDGEKTATVKVVIGLWDYGTTDFDLPQVA